MREHVKGRSATRVRDWSMRRCTSPSTRRSAPPRERVKEIYIEGDRESERARREEVQHGVQRGV